MLHTLKEIDQGILTAVNFNGPDAYSQFWSLYTDRFTWLPLAIVVLFYLLRRGGWRNALLLCLSVTVMFMLSDFAVASIIKPLVARLRPSHDPAIMDTLHYYHDYRGGMFGFPSNHASNGFAAATLLLLLFRRWTTTICAFLWAAGSCYSRLYLGVHYPTDILFGALFGMLSATLAYLLYKESYLHVAARWSMPAFAIHYRRQEPWGIAVTFLLSITMLAAVALI